MTKLKEKREAMGLTQWSKIMTLRDLRIQSGKSVAEVATELWIANSSYYNYEQGTRRISLEQVLTLAKLFDVSAEDVIRAQLNSCQFSRSDNRQ